MPNATLQAAANATTAANATMGQAGSNAPLSLSGAARETLNSTMPAFSSGSGIHTDQMFSWAGYFQAIGVLFFIIALLWLALWYLKRKGGLRLLGVNNDLRVENRVPLGSKKSLLVVRFLNKRLLLGVTDQRITLLTELAIDDDAPHPPDAPSTAEPHNAGSPAGSALFKKLLNAAAMPKTPKA